MILGFFDQLICFLLVFTEVWIAVNVACCLLICHVTEAKFVSAFGGAMFLLVLFSALNVSGSK